MLVAGLIPVEPAAAQTSTAPWDWIIQHICADASNRPVAVDPYGGCPAGTQDRRLGLQDSLPYWKHDQPTAKSPNGTQRHDLHPLRDRQFGGIISANDFDPHQPTSAAHHGYDVYRAVDGYVSSSATRDPSGYRQSIFGSSCAPWNGRVFFPKSFLLQLQPGASGQGSFPIYWDYHEQNGQPYVGLCGSTTKFNESGLTTWQFDAKYAFGGMNGALVKYIDTIISTVGFPIKKGTMPTTGYHVERHFFTDLYGHTRWESWYPTGPANTTTNCSGPTQMEYQGVTFYRQDCHDWSAVTLYPTPQPYLPWPYPETNVLVNSHFDGLQGWQYGSGLDVSVVPSTTALDTAFSQTGHGVDYLQVNCAGQCWPSQAVFQDVPISAVQAGQQVDYGFSGVVQASAGANMLVTLSIQDAQGAQLWSTSFDATVPTNSQGVFPSGSIYGASSIFLVTSPRLPNLKGAASLRLSLSPTGVVVYDILDAWMMPRSGPSVSVSVSAASASSP